MNLIKNLIRWASAWAWSEEINTCKGLAFIKKLNVEEGHMDIEIQQNPSLAVYVSTCFASMVASSPNYTEVKFELLGKYRGKHEWMTVLIQKMNGKTPHQMRQEAEKERDELRERLSKYE